MSNLDYKEGRGDYYLAEGLHEQAHDPDCQLIDKNHAGPHHVAPGHPKTTRPHDLIHAVDCWCDPLGLRKP